MHLILKSKDAIILSSILISMLFIRCDDDSRDGCYFAICTEEFRSIVVSIKHLSDNSPYELSSYKVVRTADNRDITPSSNNFDLNKGYYPIANDLKLDLFKFKDVEIDFIGYLNNSIIIQKRFIVTADCCHISLVEGETSLFL